MSQNITFLDPISSLRFFSVYPHLLYKLPILQSSLNHFLWEWGYVCVYVLLYFESDRLL